MDFLGGLRAPSYAISLMDPPIRFHMVFDPFKAYYGALCDAPLLFLSN